MQRGNFTLPFFSAGIGLCKTFPLHKALRTRKLSCNIKLKRVLYSLGEQNNHQLVYKINMLKILLYIMSFLYILAGLNHFRSPGTYMRIMPRYLPWHLQLVYLSGVLEIIFGLMLLFPVSRVAGAWCIILLLIAVFPANIQMAADFYHKKNPYLWIALLRLPLQLVLIWWAWLYTRPAAVL